MKKLDRFILREIVADGAAGTVYKADEVLPGDNLRTVALKVLPAIASADAVGQQRFFSEVKVLAQLAVQPNIVTIYAMGITEEYPWLSMEYAAATAQQHIYDEPADPAQVQRLLEEVARGLLAMHALEPPLIHQDLKPANILDAAGVYKVTDFSLATVVAANRTHGLATVRYAAPELLSAEFGRVGPATDLYALGHIAYEMALGNRLHRQQFKAVFEGNAGGAGGAKEPPPNKWMMWHASANTVPAPVADVKRDFPPQLSLIIERLMAKPLPQRYASAQEVLSDLAALKPTLSPAPAPAPFRGTFQPPLAPPAAGTSPPPPTSPSPPSDTSSEIVAPAPLSPPTPPAPPTAPSLRNSVPRAVPNQAAAVRYWVRLRGRVTGPYDIATLQRQLRQGLLSRLHQISTDQITWKSTAEIESLQGPTVV